MPSKVVKILPITFAILSKELRMQPYYIIEKKFAVNSVKLHGHRIIFENYKKKLFVTQKGICPHCNLTLTHSSNGDFLHNKYNNTLKLHNSQLVVATRLSTKYKHKATNSIKNLTLVHKMCYSEIISNKYY